MSSLSLSTISLSTDESNQPKNIIISRWNVETAEVILSQIFYIILEQETDEPDAKYCVKLVNLLRTTVG